LALAVLAALVAILVVLVARAIIQYLAQLLPQAAVVAAGINILLVKTA
jgi:hypothetical protein